VHPLFASQRRLALYAGLWVALGVARAAFLAAEHIYSWPTALLLSVPLALVFGFMCAASWYVCRAEPLTSELLVQSVGVQLLAAVLAAGLWVGLAALWKQLVTLEPLPRFVQVSMFVSGVLLYLLVAAAYYVVIAAEESRTAQRNALQAAVLAREAELKALRAQINPHFLFNSLHSISALTTSDPQAARTMCLRLGDFLRGGLTHGAMDEVPLGGELAMLEQYLGIEQIRFGRRLQVQWNCDTEARECRLPPLLLQPLVENAVRHGIATLVDGGTIVIGARRTNGRLQLSIENPYDPDESTPRGAGVGLQNVRERLETRYGGACAVRVEQASGRYRVSLELPATVDS
jgi:two-component system, LytTR family, sensor histidine kinase AlgZ